MWDTWKNDGNRNKVDYEQGVTSNSVWYAISHIYCLFCTTARKEPSYFISTEKEGYNPLNPSSLYATAKVLSCRHCYPHAELSVGWFATEDTCISRHTPSSTSYCTKNPKKQLQGQQPGEFEKVETPHNWHWRDHTWFCALTDTAGNEAVQHRYGHAL